MLPTLEFYFEITGRDTVCEGARLDDRGRARASALRHVRQEWEIEMPAFVCPRCGPERCEVLSGEEFEVESIEVEEEEVPACTAPR